MEPPAVPNATEIRVAMPGGRAAALAPGEVLEATERAGFYRITYLRDQEVIDAKTVAFSFPPHESELTPRTIEVPADPQRPGLSATGRQSLARWVLAVALLLLVLEWWWAHGRPGLESAPTRVAERDAA